MSYRCVGGGGVVAFGSSIRSFSCVFVRSPSFSFDYGRFRLLGGGRGFVRFVDSFVFVRFRSVSFVFVRLRTVSFVGGGRGFVRFVDAAAMAAAAKLFCVCRSFCCFVCVGKPFLSHL